MMRSRKGGGNIEKADENAHKRKRKKKSREDYLNNSADLLCKAAYELCENNFGKKSRKESPPDAKSLKETCCAVKEAINIASGLYKEDETDNDSIRVLMSTEAEEYSV